MSRKRSEVESGTRYLLTRFDPGFQRSVIDLDLSRVVTQQFDREIAFGRIKVIAGRCYPSAQPDQRQTDQRDR